MRAPLDVAVATSSVSGGGPAAPANVDPAELVQAGRELERQGRAAAARLVYERALRRLCTAATAEAGHPTAASLLRWIGNTHRADGDGDAARDCFEASLASATAYQNRSDTAHALNWLGVDQHEHGNLEAAEALYARARALAETAPDARLIAMIDQNLATIAVIRGQLGLALALYRQSLESYRRLADHGSLARLLNNMGIVEMELERWAAAEEWFAQSAAMADATGDLRTRAMIEVNRVDLEVRRGNLERAQLTCSRAYHLASRIDHRIALGEIYKWYGIIYRGMARYAAAESHLDAAADVAERQGNLLLLAEVQRERARLFRLQDRNQSALQALNHAHRLFTQLGAARLLRDVDRNLAELRRIYLDVVRRWGDSIEQKDHYTRGHCQRVADYACMLARAAELDDQIMVWFQMGAFLHDVGKTAIPAEILNKEGPLTDDEWRIMKRHTLLGVELLSSMAFPWDIRPMVRSHHEHWDGSGYPDGLAGEAIPLEARILCVADVFDALTTTRSYRASYSPAEALQVMRADVGRVFDPRLFKLFERAIRRRASGRRAAA